MRVDGWYGESRLRVDARSVFRAFVISHHRILTRPYGYWTWAGKGQEQGLGMPADIDISNLKVLYTYRPLNLLPVFD